MNNRYLFLQFFLAFSLFFGSNAALNATTYQLTGLQFNAYTWSDQTSWIPQGIPGANDTAIIDLSNVLYLNGDVTVGTLIIKTLHNLTSYSTPTLTIKKKLICEFPVAFNINIKIASTATAFFNNDNYPNNSPYASISIQGNLQVDGALTSESMGISANEILINGTLTHKKGNLYGNIKINAPGVLNLNVPNKSIYLGKIDNAGTFNWQAGNIWANNDFNNSGIFNITTTNDTSFTQSYFVESYLYNTGQINVADNVQYAGIGWRTQNTGVINIAGNGKLAMFALNNQGTVTGTNATLELSGYYYNTGNVFASGSVVNVKTLSTAYLSQIWIKEGANIANIKNFYFENGQQLVDVPLPPAANYDLRGQTTLGTNQTFTGNILIKGGAFTGPYSLTFNTTNATWDNAGLNTASVTVTENSIITMSGGGADNLVNNGVINWNSPGNFLFTTPGITNNGTWNVTTKNAVFYGYPDQLNYNFFNNGNLTVDVADGGLLTFYGHLENNSNVTVAANDSLLIVGQMKQKASLTGSSNSFLQLSSGEFLFESGSTTDNFDAINVTYTYNCHFKNGAIFNNIKKISLESSEAEANLILNPLTNYSFSNSTLRLTTTFEPATTLFIKDSDIEGSGNLRIKTKLDWEGGTLDIPTRLGATAEAIIRESLTKRPIISSPFTNLGKVTLNGGIIEINTSFFKNTGTWQVQSTEDVIMDGFTSFVNEGTFAICGNLPIRIVFNIPLVNQELGTFKGEGSYVFNAGYTNVGSVAPGCSPGILVIDDNFQTGISTNIEIESETAGNYDKLMVNGDLTLGGLLRVLVPTGASPNGAITVIECTGNITGTFASVEMPAGYAITYTAQSVVITTDGSVDNKEIIDAADFQIIPTLVENVVMITRSQSASSETNLQIFDAQGRLAFERALGKDESSVTLSLGHLVSGVYLVRVGKKVERLVRI
jgi:hypothetical protein